MKLKLMTWNIWYKESLNNIDNVITEIKKYDPDIVCLQEVNEKEDNRIVDKLLSSFNYGKFALADITADKRIQGNVIMSKFPIINSKTVHIAPKNIIGTKNYSAEGRVYLECEINLNSKKIKIGTTHCSYTPKFIKTNEKDMEIEKLLNELKKHKEDFIFAGDLNTTFDNGYIKQIEKYLKPCGPDYSEKTWTTKPFSYNGFEEDNLNWRLDYVFSTKDIKTNTSQIINTNLSDHLPILTTFEI